MRLTGSVWRVVVAGSLLALLGGCAGEPTAAPPTSAPPTSAPTTTAPPAEESPAAQPPAEQPATAPTTPPPAAPTSEPAAEPTGEPLATDLADGRHAVYLHGVDVGARTLTVDVIQFLGGEEAAEAYNRDHPEDPSGPPNGYYILNVNPRLRTLTVAAGVGVQLVRLRDGRGAGLEPGTFQELPGYLTDYEPEDDERLSYNPFWVTLDGGWVTAIEEQYIP